VATVAVGREGAGGASAHAAAGQRGGEAKGAEGNEHGDRPSYALEELYTAARGAPGAASAFFKFDYGTKKYIKKKVKNLIGDSHIE
jgi:hypothetical protein